MQAVMDAAEYRRQISRLALRHFRETLPLPIAEGNQTGIGFAEGAGTQDTKPCPLALGTKTALPSVPWRYHLRHWGAGQSLERAVTSCGSERHRTEFSAALTSSSSAGP